MVKTVNQSNKQKYQKKQSNVWYIYGGIALALIIGLGVFFAGGQGGSSNALAGPAPSGSNCPENVAYLQVGVDKYKEVTGQFPTDVNQLLEKVSAENPAVQKLPACPSGNIYIIDNGVVKEAPGK